MAAMMKSPMGKKRILSADPSSPMSSAAGSPDAKRRLRAKTGSLIPKAPTGAAGAALVVPEGAVSASVQQLDVLHASLYTECESIFVRFPGLSGIRLLNKVFQYYRHPCAAKVKIA